MKRQDDKQEGKIRIIPCDRVEGLTCSKRIAYLRNKLHQKAQIVSHGEFYIQMPKKLVNATLFFLFGQLTDISTYLQSLSKKQKQEYEKSTSQKQKEYINLLFKKIEPSPSKIQTHFRVGGFSQHINNHAATLMTDQIIIEMGVKLWDKCGPKILSNKYPLVYFKLDNYQSSQKPGASNKKMLISQFDQTEESILLCFFEAKNNFSKNLVDQIMVEALKQQNLQQQPPKLQQKDIPKPQEKKDLHQPELIPKSQEKKDLHQPELIPKSQEKKDLHQPELIHKSQEKKDLHQIENNQEKQLPKPQQNQVSKAQKTKKNKSNPQPQKSKPQQDQKAAQQDIKIQKPEDSEVEQKKPKEKVGFYQFFYYIFVVVIIFILWHEYEYQAGFEDLQFNETSYEMNFLERGLLESANEVQKILSPITEYVQPIIDPVSETLSEIINHDIVVNTTQMIKNDINLGFKVVKQVFDQVLSEQKVQDQSTQQHL